MYLGHFGFKEFPFGITPDTSYFFSSGTSQEALNTLLVAARTGEGFIKITGEVGTGKTLLCRKLLNSLGPEFVVAYIPNPYLQPEGLILELASELGVEQAELNAAGSHVAIRAVIGRLLAAARSGKRVVVCLDEAQAMPIETLEALRLLTNLETEKRKLLQVIIFGQPELEEKLDHPSIRQLKQRITFHYHLQPLKRAELDYYIHHRLMVAGHTGGRIFTPAALWLLRKQTRRVPRLVNIVAHKSLLSAYGKGKQTVGFTDVLAACRDTGSVGGSDSGRARTAWLLASFCGAAIALGWMYTR